MSQSWKSRFSKAELFFINTFKKQLTPQELLEAGGLLEKKDAPITDLSYGEQRQVEVILALASKPKLMLLDEPSAGLSVGETARLVDVIRNMRGDTTTFFCGHDMDLVFRMRS